MSALNQRKITIQGGSTSFGGCKESRNTKSKEDEQNGTDRNGLWSFWRDSGDLTKQKNKSPAACEGLTTEISMTKKKKSAGSSAASHFSFILHEFVLTSEERDEYCRQLSAAEDAVVMRARRWEYALSFTTTACWNKSKGSYSEH